MRTRSLGAEGPEVSVVGLGTNNFGGRIDYDASLAVLNEAIEQGITLVDTADIYSQGTSEEFIGRALEGRRDAVFVATKFGKPMNEHPSDARGSRDYIRWAIAGSLRRLRTDHVDVLYCHRPLATGVAASMLGVDRDAPDDETVRDALGELANQIGGTIKRKLGASGQEIKLSVPVVVAGAPLSHCVKSDTEPVCVELEMQEGHLCVCLWAA